MSAHTPGPWAFGSFGRLLVVPVVDGVPQKHSPICDLGPQHFPSTTEAYSNAELISAAPEMLAALQAYQEWTSGKADADLYINIVAQMRAAIAKATGADQGEPT